MFRLHFFANFRKSILGSEVQIIAINSVLICYFVFFSARVSNEFVNQYWPVLYKEMIQETKEIWEPIMIREANKMTLNIPFRTFMYFSEDSA